MERNFYKQFEGVPPRERSEMPSNQEKLELAKEKLAQIKEKLSKINLPKNQPDGKEFLPAHFTEQEKREISQLQQERKGLEAEINYLEEQEGYKKK